MSRTALSTVAISSPKEILDPIQEVTKTGSFLVAAQSSDT